MKITKAPKIKEYYDKKIEEVFQGKRSLPAITYGHKRTEWHLSDLTSLCLMQPFLHRTLKNPPYNPASSCWKFLIGRMLENAIASELEPVKKDGIIGTVDDKIGNDLIEIKATREGTKNFNPFVAHPDWLDRIMGYCNMYNRKSMCLFVIHYCGNLMDYTPWRCKELSSKEEMVGQWFKTKYENVTTDSWRVTFDSKELEAFWSEVVELRDIMDNCVKTGNPPPDGLIEKKPEWLCGTESSSYQCMYQADCPYYLRKEIGI